MRGRYPHKKVTIDGICFDSGSEGQYYLVLKDLLREGKIANLERQVPFEVIPEVWEERIKHLKTKDKVEKKRVQQATYYIADFVYDDLETGEHVVVDVKSEATRSDPAWHQALRTRAWQVLRYLRKIAKTSSKILQKSMLIFCHFLG